MAEPVDKHKNSLFLGTGCKSSDPIYEFKVRDYTAYLVGRKHEDGYYYVQRGDGFIYKYDADRVTMAIPLKPLNPR